VDLSNAVRAGGPGGARGRIAQVTEINGAFKIVLMDGRRLDDLELALLPVLPVESVRVQRPPISGTCSRGLFRSRRGVHSVRCPA
jgi:hypothetical protein